MIIDLWNEKDELLYVNKFSKDFHEKEFGVDMPLGFTFEAWAKRNLIHHLNNKENVRSAKIIGSLKIKSMKDVENRVEYQLKKRNSFTDKLEYEREVNGKILWQ